ncbi:MAG: Fic family protein [Myxococcales bacterium]|nr:Fic family protein [Nevskiaceae bacterium]MBV9949944.1 Fic family protein [Myxococcales bacterium]
MSRYSSHDPYLDPASGVLKNRFGIADEATLEATEASLVAFRSYELAQRPLAGKFDLAHLQAIHRYLFGDVYEWAGQLRTIDISKGGNAFAHHGYIVTAAQPIFAALAREQHLAGLLPPAFSARAAHYLGEINALHPFREGNGRAQREFVSHLAHANGYYLAWESIAPDRMLQASIESFHGNVAKLAAIIHENLTRLEQAAPTS